MATNGTRCPQCGSAMSKVNGTRLRQYKWQGKVKVVAKRYRECLHCGHTWPTLEIDEEDLEPILESQRGIEAPLDPTLRTLRD
jgi:transcriptional regulator NrdR family protein